MFLLGGADGVADEASRRLVTATLGCRCRYGSVRIESYRLTKRRPCQSGPLKARTDILLVAFGQPKGERWIVRNLDRLGIPVSVQVGASLDFAANRIPALHCGCRIAAWSGRPDSAANRAHLFPRYVRNAWFIARMVATHSWHAVSPNAPGPGGLT